MYECALSAGLTSSGADAYLLHVTTTPSVSYIARVDDFDCGVMISASHNPYHDNGIKLLNGQGEKMEESVLDEIEAYLDGVAPEPPHALSLIHISFVAIPASKLVVRPGPVVTIDSFLTF